MKGVINNEELADLLKILKGVPDAITLLTVGKNILTSKNPKSERRLTGAS